MEPQPKDTPDVAAIMHEIRAGLAETEVSRETQQAGAVLVSLQTSLEQMTACSNILGQCQGSLRGKLCQALSPAVTPVGDQINRFHQATLDTLQILTQQLASLEQRLQQLEAPSAQAQEAHPE